MPDAAEHASTSFRALCVHGTKPLERDRAAVAHPILSNHDSPSNPMHRRCLTRPSTPQPLSGPCVSTGPSRSAATAPPSLSSSPRARPRLVRRRSVPSFGWPCRRGSRGLSVRAVQSPHTPHGYQRHAHRASTHSAQSAGHSAGEGWASTWTLHMQVPPPRRPRASSVRATEQLPAHATIHALDAVHTTQASRPFRHTPHSPCHSPPAAPLRQVPPPRRPRASSSCCWCTSVNSVNSVYRTVLL